MVNFSSIQKILQYLLRACTREKIVASSSQWTATRGYSVATAVTRIVITPCDAGPNHSLQPTVQGADFFWHIIFSEIFALKVLLRNRG
jgi:hypothetical protein